MKKLSTVKRNKSSIDLFSRIPMRMRITPFLLAGFLMQANAENVYSQSAVISIEMNNATVEEVLNEIEMNSGYHFLYNNQLIDVDRKVSVKADADNIESVLHDFFEGTNVAYKIVNKQIVLGPKSDNGNINSESVKQARIIKGCVVDKDGVPVIGANLRIKGTTTGTITDVDGNFSLEAKSNDVIVVSYIGYSDFILKVTDKSSYSITLKEDSKALDEVVVVGYGTQKKVNWTGSIGTVKTDATLKSRPVTNVQELLSSSVPGMVVNKSSGAAGSGASINIRGTSTIGNSSGVLILIDGMPGNIYTLNPNDIESISVLKDAASAAIYGSRAANGVMLITTKTAKSSQRPTIELSNTVGIQNPQFKLDFVGSEDFMRLYDQAMINDGKDPIYGEQGLADLRAGKYANNKWYKEIYQRNTVINNTYIALSGKEKSISYRVSVSDDYQEGNLPNNTYNRLIFKPDLHFQLLKNLEAHASFQYTQTNITNPNGGTEIWQSQAARISPVTPIYNPDGSYASGGAMGGNPVAGVNESGYSKERHKEMMAIFDIAYSPIKNLNLKANISTYSQDTDTKNRTYTYYLYDVEGNIAKTENPISSLKENTSYNFRTQLQFTADYVFTIKDVHNLKFLAGYSQEYYKTDGFWASRDDLPFNSVDVLDTGSSNKQNGGNASDVAVQSWFSRFNYDYQGKYLFEVSARADGSSRFAKGHRWGVFPSFSVGWNLHREAFMESTNDWLSEFKIRASYGMLGDAEKVDYYATAQVLSYDPKIYTFNGKLVGGAYNNVAVNSDITWERSKYTNIGLDLGFWNQKVKFTLDYFNNLRDDILYTPPVPSEFGLNAPYSNLLKMKNQGMDIMMSYQDSRGDFHWGIDMNMSYSKNKVLEMGESNRWIENNSVTYLNDRYQLPFGYEAEGLFQNEEDIKSHADQGDVLPGNIKYKDQNGDDIIDGEDRVVLNRKIPVNFGLNLSFGWRDFDFSVNMYGKLNTKKYMSGYEGWAFYLSDNARPMHLDAWTPENPDASYPRLTLSNTSNDYDSKYNSFWLRKADYLKIQNVQIGYTIPKDILSKVNIKYLRLYLSGQNLGTITGYDGFDPEGGWYPLARTFSFGFNLQF